MRAMKKFVKIHKEEFLERELILYKHLYNQLQADCNLWKAQAQDWGDKWLTKSIELNILKNASNK